MNVFQSATDTNKAKASIESSDRHLEAIYKMHYNPWRGLYLCSVTQNIIFQLDYASQKGRYITKRSILFY